jgi:membrane-associated phospholipid phosphatase
MLPPRFSYQFIQAYLAPQIYQHRFQLAINHLFSALQSVPTTDKLDSLARLISNTIHPIVLPIVTFWILMRYGFDRPIERLNLYLLVVTATCSISPALVVIVLKKMGRVSDYDISKRENRTLPFIFGVLSYFIGAFVLWQFDAPALVVGFMLCYAVNTIFIFFITLVWKISVHITSLGGPIAALTYTFGWQLLWTALLMPPLAWARVRLKAHTPMQTLAGGSLGFFATLFELVMWFGAGKLSSLL